MKKITAWSIGFVCIALSGILANEISLPEFEEWVGYDPHQEILGMNMFTNPDFQREIKKIMPVAVWRKVLDNSNFQIVQRYNNWLVITGNSLVSSGDTDVAIWINRDTQHIEGVCLASAMRAYISYPDDNNLNNEPRPLHITIINIEYFTQEGQFFVRTEDEFSFCGRGNAQKTIDLWEERRKEQRPIPK